MGGVREEAEKLEEDGRTIAGAGCSAALLWKAVGSVGGLCRGCGKWQKAGRRRRDNRRYVCVTALLLGHDCASWGARGQGGGRGDWQRHHRAAGGGKRSLKKRGPPLQLRDWIGLFEADSATLSRPTPAMRPVLRALWLAGVQMVTWVEEQVWVWGHTHTACGPMTACCQCYSCCCSCRRQPTSPTPLARIHTRVNLPHSTV